MFFSIVNENVKFGYYGNLIIDREYLAIASFFHILFIFIPTPFFLWYLVSVVLFPPILFVKILLLPFHFSTSETELAEIKYSF